MDIYRVIFSDGSSTEVTEDHLWAVNSPLRKWRERPLQVKSLREIMSKPLIHPTTGNYQVFIPMVQPVEFTQKELPLDPYLLGVLIGDGSLTKHTIFFTSCDKEIIDEVVRLLPEDIHIKPHGRCNWFFSSNRSSRTDSLRKALSVLGLKGHLAADKFIPDCYLYSSVQDRLALLQGLCDTDGSVSNNLAVEYVTISSELALNVKELVQSLGGTVNIGKKLPTFTHKGVKKQGRLAYRLYIKLPSHIMPFRLPRKAKAYRPQGKYEPHRSIVKIEHVGQDYAQCIMLDSKNQLYVTDEYIVTHNTTIGSGVMDLLDAYPAIVLCPPHLVPKWIREIEETIPGAKAMEITRIGRNADNPGDVNDVRRFLELYKSGELGKKPVAVIAHTSAKYGAGWEHAVVRRKFVDDEDGRMFEGLCCPTCGSPIQIDLPGGFVKVATTLNDLGDKRRFCEAEISDYEMDDHKHLKRDEHGNPVWGKRKCRTPLFQFTGRRWAIADYIAKHARGEFKLLIADELHQFAAKASDRGIAFHQLVEATKYSLTLTGTFFGGKSTSIFWLLHRLNAGVRKDFAFNDEKRWARLYGVLEMTRKSKRAEEDGDEDGYTGNRRYQNQAKEKPGISPAIVNRLLDTTIFLSLKDLGLALPHYAEEVVTLEMTDEQSSQYQVMAKKLYDLAIKNRRYLSTWLQWTLARPNSAFRDEVVEVDEVNQKREVIRRKELMELPAVVDEESMPKESWLVDFCRTERQQGRKVLIYLRQTGTRDIQDRILKVLRDGGVRAEVLTSGVNPRKREEWIAKRVVGLDALVVNPRLVETGLDLVAFSSVVFAEIEYSLYTLWQAVRRVWRLGQTKPVKAIFSVYSEAMEARALALMGQKMKAAQLLYGDEVGGAIVPEEDGDILMKLAREALESADLPDLQSLFADEVVVSNSPMGCPTAPSVSLPVSEMPKTVSWSDWMTNKGVVGRVAGRARPKQTTQNQVSLF
jgi:superfamily II DNA or RNA helicase